MNSWKDDSCDWQNLASSIEAPRYREVARLIDRFCPKGTVLDVGCGAAVLRDYLDTDVPYLGIEPSAKAVESARAKYGYDSIIHSTGDDFDPGKCRWDCIVFNEMLYYLSDPLSLLAKYARRVTEGGIIVVSIYQSAESFDLAAKLRHWLDWRRPISNTHCTEMVHDFMVRDGWLVERDEMVGMPGSSEYWRIWAAKPRPPIT